MPKAEDSIRYICVRGAKVHNLKNVSVNIPRHKMTVVTGVSGSGKSSLAFDTILAEGQRRYLDTMSAYARSFIGGGNSTRPNVESIDGLSPVISIDQKTTNSNPRSTVGTVTEIYDFLRLLYARVATPYSYITGKPMVQFTFEQLKEHIITHFAEQGVEILAPVVIDRKGHYRELFEQNRKRGFLQAYIDGEIKDLTYGMSLNRYQKHYVAILIDKFSIRKENEDRLTETLTLALKLGDGMVDIRDRKSGTVSHLSRKLMDPESGLSYPTPSPGDFSFNSPRGYCPKCRGLGEVEAINTDKLFPNKSLSVRKGGIAPLGKWRTGGIFTPIARILKEHGQSLDTPVGELTDETLFVLLYGENSLSTFLSGNIDPFPGIVSYLAQIEAEKEEDKKPGEITDPLVHKEVCPECHGERLNKIARHYQIGDYSLPDLCALELEDLPQAIQKVLDSLTGNRLETAATILSEVSTRVQFLLDVGVGYLSLDRATASLSGGESQRIRLATQIGTGLVEVLYILDEPGIGLHQRDNRKLITSLQKLCAGGNTVLVVEHDRDMMLSADYIIDMGPGAGRLGGHVVFEGTPAQVAKGNSLTTDFLNGKRAIPLPESYTTPDPSRILRLIGASGNNLRGVSVDIPLGLFVCVTGVSGSGKSSLINATLVPILSQKLYHSTQIPLPYKKIEGVDLVDKVAVVDQRPIGRTPRSNPATYTGVFSLIRDLFALTAESKARGYKPGRFSFNVKGGRCEECGGNGYKTISMNFLPDVTTPCPVCRGKRYNRETLEVRYKGKSIADVLDLTINQACEFFEHLPKIYRKLLTLKQVGLGYVKLGQPSTTLSGGENQRVKLSAELARKDTGKSVYVLDEPTTGLHFEDIRVLLKLVRELTNRGNTVIIIEHNLDVIKCADYIIDMGPEGGKEGGKVIFSGSPQEMLSKEVISGSATAFYLKEEMERTPQGTIAPEKLTSS